MIAVPDAQAFRRATQVLQTTVAAAGAADEYHNCLTLKVIFGLELFTCEPVWNMTQVLRSQFELTHHLGGEPLPLLSARGHFRRRRVPLVPVLLPDLSRVLNPRGQREARAFGWRECGRFVPLHLETISRRWQRLGLFDVWCRAPELFLLDVCPALDGLALDRVAQKPTDADIQAWADFRQAAMFLASELGWAPSPEFAGAGLPRPNVQMGEHGIFALGFRASEVGDLPTAVARW